MQFTKLFSSILDSTIWQESPATKLVWITMLAMADKSGEVHASIPGLAKRAGVSLQECEAALECLLSPDKYSRTPDFGGRRIQPIDGGWELLNHSKYRALLSKEERREYNRLKQAEYRGKKREAVNDVSMTVNDNVSNAHITEAEAEAEADSELSTNTKERESLPLPPLATFWNSFDKLPKIQTWSKPRKTSLATRMRDPFFNANWQAAVAKVASSPFLTGSNDRGWKADITWFLKPDSIAKIMECKYEGAPAANNGGVKIKKTSAASYGI